MAAVPHTPEPHAPERIRERRPSPAPQAATAPSSTAGAALPGAWTETTRIWTWAETAVAMGFGPAASAFC